MTHNKRKEMNEALNHLRRVFEIERRMPGALPGKALRHVREAIKFIEKDPMMQKEKNKRT